MNDRTDGEKAVENPTYMRDIRKFFCDRDIGCMAGHGIDLATYEGVKFNADRIYFRTRDGNMPPQPDRRWSQARVQTFYNWMKNGYPRGVGSPTSEPATSAEAELAEGTRRLRKDLASIDPDSEEMAKLKKAFQGLIDRDPDDPDSYFQLAGQHWLPEPDVYCRHHENAYNPWHRAYLQRFEDALRSVEGCEDVTLPYWNIQSKAPDRPFRVFEGQQLGGIPDVLFEAPFADYTFPRELKNLNGDVVQQAGSHTKRRDEAAILSQIEARGINDIIERALNQSHWEKFNGWDGSGTQTAIILAHDNGHVSCGETMANQDVAAFDPIFWFFHCNWDRLWWKWQKRWGAITLDSFKTHLEGPSDWLEDDVLNTIAPFDYRTKDTIDLTKTFEVDYGSPVGEPQPPLEANEPAVSMSAAAESALADTDNVAVRVEGVDRLNIPGSFDLNLLAGNKVIGHHSLFQSTTPEHCETCRRNARASFEFVVDRKMVAGVPLRVAINRHQQGKGLQPVCLTSCGNPTISVHHLMAEV